MKNYLLIVLAVVLSAYVGYSDLHQTDTPFTVGLILAVSFVLGLFFLKRPWFIAIIVGLGVPVAGLIAAMLHIRLSGMEHGQVKYWYSTYSSVSISLITIPIALLGVYIGQGIRKIVSPQKVY